jgi:hypothetical protein
MQRPVVPGLGLAVLVVSCRASPRPFRPPVTASPGTYRNEKTKNLLTRCTHPVGLGDQHGYHTLTGWIGTSTRHQLYIRR